MRASSSVTVAHRARTRQDFSAGFVRTSPQSDEYKRALTGAFHELPYGEGDRVPTWLRRLVKRVDYGENQVAETTTIISLAKVVLGFPRDVANKHFRVGLAMVNAQYPLDEPLKKRTQYYLTLSFVP